MSKSVEERHEELLLSREQEKELFEEASHVFLAKVSQEIRDLKSAAENNAMNIDTFREALHASRRKGIPNPEDDGGPDEGGA